MARFLLTVFIALSVLTFGLPAHAQVYTWVDAQGQVHYGDVAAAPRAAKRALVEAPAPASERNYLSSDVSSPASAGPAAPPSDAAATPPVMDDGSIQACQVAQRNRDLLADEGKQVLADDGTTVMSASARAQRLARVELEIEAFCNVLGATAGTPSR